MVGLNYFDVSVELDEITDTIKTNLLYVKPLCREVGMMYPTLSDLHGVTDTVYIHYDYNKVDNMALTNDTFTVLAETKQIMASDISSSVGDVQGTHKWYNINKLLELDDIVTAGSFGYGPVEISVDTRQGNVGSLINVNEKGLSLNSLQTKSVKIMRSNVIGFMGYLLMRQRTKTMYLLVMATVNDNGSFVFGNNPKNKAMLVPVKGRPILNIPDGTVRPNTQTTPWVTSSGELIGFLDKNGNIVTTYQ
jgi:hypothetical protein